MGGNLDPESREYIEFTIDGAKRMKGLILNLLEYSRVNRSRARFGEVDLNEVLSNVVSNLHEQIKEKEAGIKVGKMPVLRADSFQLTQLFQNLIGNAVKFNNTSSPLVEVNYEEKDGEHLFRIRDNGIGIEERYLERIFQIFERLHNREEYSGSGIGLAICKRIVENHNGRIWAESGAGKGTTFFFTISKGV
jgi:light-regulated signal transduction histidine kinase (bacteriophytochrome)